MIGKCGRGAALVAVVLCAVAAAVLYLVLRGGGGEEYPVVEEWIFPSARPARGAIASNGGPCAPIGLKMLEKGGSAVDALIATMLCDGVACMQNMGIGGGFIATMYIKSEGKVITINARETAPAASSRDMFVEDDSLSLIGGKAIAVPGEIRGYWEMHQKYGVLKWSELYEETIKLCEEGVPVSNHLQHNMKTNEKLIMSMPALKKLLVKENGKLPVYGDKIKLPQLAKTLRIIGKEGADAIYKGSLTAGLVKDIKDNGGIITEEDMASYTVRWEEPVSVKLSNGDTVHSVPLPGSGPILTLIMKLLDNELPDDLHHINTTFKITEAFKIAYAVRSRLGDPHFVNDNETLGKLNDEEYIKSLRKKLEVPLTSNDVNYYGSHYVDEDHGTANIVVYGPNGDAISATSTINTIFGSGVVSESTGIILNNEMDDFSTPGLINYFGVSPSSENYIAPFKRPMSSMAPSIVLNKNGEPKFIAGAAGGTKITTSTALAIIRNIWYNKTTTQSVREARFHHQLMPMQWTYEPKVDKQTVEGMKQRGHKVVEGAPRQSCVTAISVNGDVLGPSSDFRRPGNTSFFI